MPMGPMGADNMMPIEMHPMIIEIIVANFGKLFTITIVQS